MKKQEYQKRAMTAKYRTIVENGFYHVIQRAPGKELVFLENNDYLYFLSLLKETAKAFKIDVFCFALLPNHLHLLLRIKDKNLAKAMKFLFQSYALHFNKKYERKGHVFCGRYKAALCNDDLYLLTISLYIHLNPFKAKIANDMFTYRWSSVDPYIKPTRPSFLNTEVVLSLLSDDDKKAKESYKNLLKNAGNLEYSDILRSPKAIPNFFKKFFQLTKKHRLLTHCKNTKSFSSWDELEKKIEEIKGQKKIIKPSEKKAFAYLITQLLSSGYTLIEISQRLGLHRTTIYRLMQHNCP